MINVGTLIQIKINKNKQFILAIEVEEALFEGTSIRDEKRMLKSRLSTKCLKFFNCSRVMIIIRLCAFEG